jgi:parallel beta-helix repeat protein
MAIVGYNDDPGYWIVKNSWGTTYQDDGWVNIKYGECGIGTINFYLTGVYGKFPIVYVDDDNTHGPWDGTKEYPYRTIHDALPHVYDGYTIYVRNGTYHEHITVDKRVALLGEDKNTTIIDGDGIGDVLTVSAPEVKISGFTIQNSGPQAYNAGIKTLTLYSNVTIENTIIQYNTIGIFLNYAYEQSWDIVRNNTILNNYKGIYAHWADNSRITGNAITKNDENGLEMERSSHGTIAGNIISENGACGIYLRGASHQNEVSGGNIIQNNGIGLKITESNRNVIHRNSFIGNAQQAVFSDAFFTSWNRNYWDDRMLFFPKIIRGALVQNRFPWINVDWYPLRNPLPSPFL